MLQSVPEVFLPIIIFFARITDVSLGTIRIVMVSRGFKWRAAFLGFFELLLWTIVVAQLMQNLGAWQNYVAYAAGFSAGTFVGMIIEDKLKVGTIIVRIITQKEEKVLAEALKKAGFTITIVDGHGGFAPVKIIFTVLKRRRWNEVVSLIQKHDPDAFYSSEDVKFASSIYPANNSVKKRSPFNRLLGLRKGI